METHDWGIILVAALSTLQSLIGRRLPKRMLATCHNCSFVYRISESAKGFPKNFEGYWCMNADVSYQFNQKSRFDVWVLYCV